MTLRTAQKVAAMREASYMFAVLAGCVVSWIFLKHVERLSKPFLIFDALGTGAYGVVGASKAFEAGPALPVCIFVGVVNAVRSGLIRDVLVREEPLLPKPGKFYVIASLLGRTGFVVLAAYVRVPLVPSAISAIAIAFIFQHAGDVFQLQHPFDPPPVCPVRGFPLKPATTIIGRSII